jgi:hypothetical protein
MRDRNRPLEKPYLRAMIVSALDYLQNLHGAFVEVVVQEWLFEKKKRLEWREKDSPKEKDIIQD